MNEANKSSRGRKIVKELVWAIGILLGLGILALLVLWLLLFPWPKVCRNPARYEARITDLENLRTGLVVFPASIPDSARTNGAEFYFWYRDTVFDPEAEIYLRCTYSEADFQAELERLEHYAQSPLPDEWPADSAPWVPNPFLRDERGLFRYPAYIAILGDDFACEYALVTGEREISYVYFAFRHPGEFKKVPADCLPQPFDIVLSSDGDSCNIYYFQLPDEPNFFICNCQRCDEPTESLP